MMKVLYIVHSTSLLDGATKSLLLLLRGLQTMGVEPTVVVPNEQGLTKTLEKEGIETIITPYNMDIYPPTGGLYWTLMYYPILLVRRLRHWRSIQMLKRLCRDKGFQLVHTNTSVISLGYELAQYLNIPHIYHIREYGDLDFHMQYYPNWESLHRALHQNLSYSICITKDIRRHHGLENETRSFVVYNGIMDSIGNTRYNRTNDFFLYAGRIEQAKGVYEMVSAYVGYLEQSPNPIPLFLAGEVSSPTYKQHIETLIRQHHAEEKIQWIGPKKDIETFMQNARGIIICSPAEAFGRVMPEAMAQGCIAIAQNTAGTKEQLDNGLSYTGQEIALRYQTEDDLIKCLFLLENREEAEWGDMRNRAMQTVQHFYSNPAYIHAVKHVYNTIIKS